MNVPLSHPLPAKVKSAVAVQDPDQKRLWFVLSFPAVLAALTALVTAIGTAAALPFLLVLVPLVAYTAFRDTERALYVYFAWCWFDGTIRGVFHTDTISIIARDIVLGVITVGWGLQRLQNRHRDRLRWPPGIALVVLFIVNCLLQVFNPYAAGPVQSIGGLKMHLSAIPLLFLGYDVIRRPAQIRSMFLFLTLITLVVGLTSYVQYVQGPTWTWAHFPGTKEVNGTNLSMANIAGLQGMAVTFKPPGTTSGGGGAGAYIGIIFPLTFTLPLLSGSLKFSKVSRGALLGVLMAFIIILFINAVRSALVTGFCGIALCALLIDGKLRLRILAAIGVCLVLGAIGYGFSSGVSQGGVTDRFATTFANPVDALHQDRRTFFDDAVFIFVNSPMGVGLGRVGGAAGRLGSGSGADPGFSVFSEAYLGTIMYETGIPGGLFITAITLFFIGRGWLRLKHLTDPDEKLLLAAIVAVFIVLFANFFVTPVLLGPPGSVLFWLFGGASLRAFASRANIKAKAG